MASILVVDDDAALRDLVAAELTRHGHTVMEAADGLEGLALCRTHAFDLLIVDIVMPNLDGIEMIVTLRDEKVDTVVVAVTAIEADLTSYTSAAASIGAYRLLPKPFKLEELLTGVNEALASKRR